MVKKLGYADYGLADSNKTNMETYEDKMKKTWD